MAVNSGVLHTEAATISTDCFYHERIDKRNVNSVK